MSPVASRHRPVVLGAAVELLAEQGVRGLTHARLDARAGVPTGTTSNYFRTRDALLGGVLDHLVAQDAVALESIGAFDTPPGDRAALVDVLVALGDYLVGAGRTTTVARYAVFLEAATRPALASRVADARRQLNSFAADLLRSTGAHKPDVAAQRIMFTLDGYVLASTSHGAVDAALREVLEPVVDIAFD